MLVRTTDRVRLRGLSGSRPGGLRERDRGALGEDERGERVELGRHTVAPAPAKLSRTPSVGRAEQPHAAPGPAMLIGPWRYSKTG